VTSGRRVRRVVRWTSSIEDAYHGDPLATMSVGSGLDEPVLRAYRETVAAEGLDLLEKCV
jgi:adenosylmethionine-8-amino-7-oxononanoate aminotransferase